MKLFYILLAVVCAGGAANAQMQPGFKDFDVAAGLASSNPVYLTEFKGKLYFYGSDGNTGREPHYVQGAGTPMLIDNINAGSQNCISTGYNNPSAGMNNKFYFTATNGASGEEIFVYDGSNKPTLVADLTFGTDSSSPDDYTVMNNVLYFTATTKANGRELYKYDGTGVPARISDIDTGSGDGAGGPMIVFQNKLFFVGKTAAEGAELWVYDPILSQMNLVADIDAGTSSSTPGNMAVFNNKLYFTATTYSHGSELYVYDGSKATRLTDINPGSFSSITHAGRNTLAYFKNKVYFAARDTSGQRHVWSYDPANDNVKLEYKINPNGDSSPLELVVYNNRLFMSANDGANGFELFATDGSSAPAIIGDLCPGPNSSLPTELTVIGDELYFSANNCNNSGVDLFSYNYKGVGINHILFDGTAKIYPNPVQRDLHIDLVLKKDEQLHVRVADITGRNIYDPGMLPYSAGKNKIEVPMRGMPDGSYIYYITNKEGTTYLTGKIIKQ